MTIAIIGPGAVGGTMAAWLAKAGHDLVLGVRTSFADLEVETPSGLLRAQPRVFTEPSQAGPVDWVLVATKTYEVAATAAWLKHFVGQSTRVAILQNGVEHVSRFAPYLPADRLVPAVVECPAERLAPGRIRQRRPAWMVVPEGPNGHEFVSLFAGTEIKVSTTEDFATELWRKLCLNAAGAVSAIVGKPAGIVRIAAVADLMRGLVQECLAVARAEGAALDQTVVEAVMTAAANAPPDGVNSLLADRLAGRAMEIDARNGAIVRLGAKHGITTPLNQMAVALLVGIQESI